MDNQPISLETMTVATFNVVFFGLILVFAGHASGVLSAALTDIGTVPGLLVFGYLWGLVLVATRWALSEGGLERGTAGETSSLLSRGFVGGAFIGVAFIVGLILGSSLVGVVTLQINPFQILIISLIGGIAGTIVGSLVGLVFVLVDVGLYRITARISE